MPFCIQRTNLENDPPRFEWIESISLVKNGDEADIVSVWTAVSGNAHDFVTEDDAASWAVCISGASVVRFGDAPAPEDDSVAREAERLVAAKNSLIDKRAEEGDAVAIDVKAARAAAEAALE